MKPFILIVSAFLLFSACARLPAVTRVRPATMPDIHNNCQIPFVRNNWQFVHAIQTTMPGGHTGIMMGVTDIYPDVRTLHCVMMTIEGLVMFDAGYADGTVVINRGIPPFDSKNFAQGVMDDICLMFFRPVNQPEEIGLLDDGQPVCRYPAGNDQTIEVMVRPHVGWTLRLYRGQRLVRTINAFNGPGDFSSEQDRIPERIELIAYSPLPYHLELTRLEAIPLSD